MNNQTRFAALLSLCALTVFVSCKKDDDNNNPTPVSKRVSKYWHTAYPDTVALEYDDKGRIISVTDSEDKEVFQFSGNKLHYTEYRKTENRTVADMNYDLDGQGRLSTGSGELSYSASSPSNSVQTYDYDADGYLKYRNDSRSDGNAYAREFTYVNGNLSTEKWYENGALYLTIIYEYGTAEDKIGFDVGSFMGVSKGILGKPNKNLPAHTKSVYANGNLIGEYDFIYTLDSDGYPSKLAIKRKDAAGDDTIYYQY